MTMDGGDADRPRANHESSHPSGMAWETPPQVTVYDFFSGCGGTSAGLRRAGMKPVLAVDIDGEALKTYSANFADAVTIETDIRALATRDLEPLLERDRKNPILFSACAPCQPFSKQNRRKRERDDRASLLTELVRLLERFRPDLLFVENVPGIQKQKDDGDGPFAELKRALDRLGYFHSSRVVNAREFGVPQSRVRLILVASAFGPIQVPAATHGMEDRPFQTVRDAIGHLPPLSAGMRDDSVANHYACALSPMNMERIRALPAGGRRTGWEDRLKLGCHADLKGYTDTYGRMSWDRPAPALTTRCVSLSNGCYGHPEQDRAISMREASNLQSFEEDFVFVGSVNGIARQIGNAVPPELAHACGKALIENVAEHWKVLNG